MLVGRNRSWWGIFATLGALSLIGCGGGVLTPPDPVPEADALCLDGLDNDLDQAVDCDDPDCAAVLQCQVEICDNGQDEDADTLIDCDDQDCAADPACIELTCNDAIDNDNDGALDCDDSDCANDPVCLACGDGNFQAGEECDDGNNDDGDGCAADCTLEALSSFASAQDINGSNPDTAVFSIFGEDVDANGNRVLRMFTSTETDLCQQIVDAGNVANFQNNVLFVGGVPGAVVATIVVVLGNDPLANDQIVIGDGVNSVADAGFTFADDKGTLITDTTFGGEQDSNNVFTITTVNATTITGTYTGFQKTEFATGAAIDVGIDGTFTATLCPAITDSI